jgi:hypothetical protein
VWFLVPFWVVLEVLVPVRWDGSGVEISVQVPGSVPLPVCKALDSFNQIAHWLMSANVTHFPTPFTVGGAGPMLRRKPGSYVTKQIRFANTSAKQRERDRLVADGSLC